MSASPRDLIRFLVWKDKAGKLMSTLLDALVGGSRAPLSVVAITGWLRVLLTP